MSTTKTLLAATLILAAGVAQAEKNTVATPAAPQPAVAEAPAAPVAPVGAVLVSAANPQSVIDAMQAVGFTATIGVDNVGDPLISAEIEGTAFTVFFYGCNEKANCQWLHFQTSFDLPNGWTLEAANAWNTGKIVTDASLDAQMDPVLEFFITTTGGINEANFADALDWWKVMLAEFKTTIGA